MRILDLFAGIGGFSLAAHWMGWETVAFVEKEPFCQKVLIKNFNAVLATEGTENTDKPQIYGDIFEFSGKPFRERVDIVTGGFPCQPFSAAGKRKGRADERHLFPEMLRVIREVEPVWVVAENVRGLLSVESGAVFAEVIASLEGEGFEVVTFCVPASAVEAPHRRDRLWIVAHANGVGKRARHRKVQSPDGEISERNDDSEFSDTNQQRSGLSEHTERDGLTAGKIRRSDAAANGKQPARSNAAADIAGTDRHASDSTIDGFGDRGIGREMDYSPGSESGRRDQSSSSALCRTADATHADDRERPGLEFGFEPAHAEPGDDGCDDSAAESEGLERRNRNRAVGSHSAGFDRGQCSQWDENWIEAAARLCRMDDGVSDRVHRLKALGNSVVPWIPYEIFRAIEAAEKQAGAE
jgi:DNA (cytosine-5)-methyltransferase 1